MAKWSNEVRHSFHHTRRLEKVHIPDLVWHGKMNWSNKSKVDISHLLFLVRGSHIKEGSIKAGKLEAGKGIWGGRKSTEEDVSGALLCAILS